MAFSYSGGGGTFGSGGVGASSSQAQAGPDLVEIQTEGLGFKGFNQDIKIKLFPTPWPSDALPPPTSSLLSIASNKGLLAAAGPDSVILGALQNVRESYGDKFAADGNPISEPDIRPFKPDATIPIGTRISQVAFASDGGMLVLSAEMGGGLAIYDTESLKSGNTQSLFELSTDGKPVRALTPNPALPELFAVVTVEGVLTIANMNNRQFVQGANNQVLIVKDGVSCVSWSNKGKQLVAGLGNGSAYQLKPDGTAVAEIPRPPALQGEYHISAISWIADNTFLIAYTPSSPGDGLAPASEYYIINRQKEAPFVFQKLPEVCNPFGLNRSPAFQFMQRMRNFEPGLKEVVILASTASQDINLITKSEMSLTNDVPADSIHNQFTVTTVPDSRRAQLPMTEDMTSDTSAIGMALDLSQTVKIKNPILGAEDVVQSAPGPLPALLVLNNEGVLCAWWFVYDNSIRQSLSYSGLLAIQGQQTQTGQIAPSNFGNSGMASTPFGAASQAPAFGSTSTFGAQSGALGSTTSPANKAPTFGSTSTPGIQPGTFGSSGVLGNKPSWAASTVAPSAITPALGQPTFGSTGLLGANSKPSFGNPGGLGAKASLWNTPATSSAATTANTFGQASSLGSQKPNSFGGAAPTASPFSSTTTSSTSGGFASFASGGGFASAASTATPKADGASIFGKGTPAGTFGSTSQNDMSLTSTPKKDESSASGGLFGAPKGGFNIGSAWKNSDAGKENDKPAQGNMFGSPDGKSQSLFGSGLGEAIDDASKATPAPVSNEAEMTSDNEDTAKARSPEPKPPQTTTPAATPAASKFFSAPPAAGGLFGTQSQGKTTPVAVQKSEPTPSIFGKPSASAPEPNTPVVKEEPRDEDQHSNVSKDIPQAPLPPDPTSKTSYTPGTSSTSSVAASKASVDDAPLPPDFLQTSSKPKDQFNFGDVPLPPDFAPTVAKSKATAPPEDAPLPPDFLPSKTQPSTSKASGVGAQPLPEDKEDEGLDDEGSGVDVAQELSPTTDESPKVTPESSFGQKYDKSPLGGSFAKVSEVNSKPASKPLFGELGTPPTTFLPPSSRPQLSPRSPSPVRRALGGDLSRPDNARSVSAPGVPLRMDTTRKVTQGRPMPNDREYPPQLSLERQQREERERQAMLKAKAQEEEQQELSDDDDEILRYELNSEVRPTRYLSDFQAHQDYVGKVNKPGIPGQIERVYRDINSMVDTLGINSRSLQSWIKGQEELYPDNGRVRDDLDNFEDWCIDEIDNLVALQSDLEAELAAGRLQDLPDKIAACRSLRAGVRDLRTKRYSVSKMIATITDPEVQENFNKVSLSPEQDALSRDLRKKYQEFQLTVSEAEQALSMLQAKLVAHEASNGKSKNSQKTPTVEAVEKTILKMTSMVEKKSGDIDFLETQMRKLGVRGDTPLSREASPFVTPPTSARKSKAVLRTPGSSVNGNGFYTPQSGRSRFANSVVSITSDSYRSPRKKLSEITQSEASQYAIKAAQKKQIHALLKEALVSGEVCVRTLDDV